MNWIKKSACAVALGLLYLAVFLWFRSHDVWSVSTDVPAGDMLAWTALRLFFIIGLGAACLTTGRVVLMGQTKGLQDFSILERMLFYFFVGAAVIRMGMFFVGLQGLYKPLWAFFASLPLVVLFPFVFSGIFQCSPGQESTKRNLLEGICVGSLYLVAAVILGVVYLARCQYSFDGDYLTHYGPFYDAVVRSGRLAPNDVWYQYFYSKGAGLFYLSMLITDRTGPFLVSFLHFFSASLLVYAVMKRASGSPFWALSTAIFMLGMMAWPNEGFFIKHHCEISSILLSITCTAVLMTAFKRYRDLFLFTACILQVSLLLYSLQAGVYTFLFIAVYAGIALFRRDAGLALRYATLLGLSAVVSALLMLHNHFLTGLYEVTPFRIFLHFWDQEIFSKWVSPYLMFYVSEGSSSEFGTVGISGMFHDVAAYARLFRLQKFFFSGMFWSVTVLAGALGAWGVLRKISKKHAGESPKAQWGLSEPAPERTIYGNPELRGNVVRWVLLPSLIMCALVFLAYVFVRHSISILRLSEFVSMYVTMFIFSALIVCTSWIPSPAVYRIASLLVPMMLSGAACSWTLDHGRNGKLKTPLQFALGEWPANKLAPVNIEVSRQFSKIKAVAGGDRIVSFNLNADYGPLFLQYPGIMTEVSYAFENRWHDIVFGDSKTAKEVLQEMDINFFLVDLGSPMFGAMPYAPLFTGQSLSTHFRIVWQLGSRYLLTWNHSQENLGTDFLKDWTNCLQRGMPSTLKGTANYGQALYERVLYLYQLNNHAVHGIVRPESLPKVEGWQ